MNRFEIIKTTGWPEYDLKVTLKPCFRCNHKCWFCEEYDNNTKVWSKEQCDIVLDKLKNIPKENKRIFFYFYGGEPTLTKHWEYLNYNLLEIFSDRELYIQTQTNLSLTYNRLHNFFEKVKNLINDRHVVNICSSYHLDKQSVDDFISKMKLCDEYDCLGLCFFSTEIPKHEQCVSEFKRLLSVFPDKIKLRFTETENLVNKNIPGYEKYLEDDYLIGTDKGKSMEFRYWLNLYPEWRVYFEKEWNFSVDGETYNFSEVSGNNIHKKFKYMKCQCGTKGMVIDHNLYAYHCNDDYYRSINSTRLQDVNMETYFARDVRCLNSACYDGLDFIKYKKI